MTKTGRAGASCLRRTLRMVEERLGFGLSFLMVCLIVLRCEPKLELRLEGLDRSLVLRRLVVSRDVRSEASSELLGPPDGQCH
jgi:hypothetical protein